MGVVVPPGVTKFGVPHLPLVVLSVGSLEGVTLDPASTPCICLAGLSLTVLLIWGVSLSVASLSRSLFRLVGRGLA